MRDSSANGSKVHSFVVNPSVERRASSVPGRKHPGDSRGSTSEAGFGRSRRRSGKPQPWRGRLQVTRYRLHVFGRESRDQQPVTDNIKLVTGNL